ncbi:MAG: hypothetical protein ABF629_08380 [Sporolactobacillus sp.]|uniref:hypothetical protein n=1 Tax=Sporolactobacillus sp. STSJ-5 TaxID=2965076 RepID=UPI00210638A5|nr:hypothetical protein [Sporolactobacillus sp. STSJ-5]MCQ2009434.1 hypothetical protein [Sporolactobacillus sp. STSJ-5]
MTETNNGKTISCFILIILHFFLGVGAVFGGGALILSPDGTLLHMPLELLKYTAFDSFLIPGIILFSVLGLYPIYIAFLLIFEKPMLIGERIRFDSSASGAWNHSLYIGFLLIGWITIEAYLMHDIVFIHVFYIFLGLAIQAVTVLPSVKKHYSISGLGKR